MTLVVDQDLLPAVGGSCVSVGGRLVIFLDLSRGCAQENLLVMRGYHS